MNGLSIDISLKAYRKMMAAYAATQKEVSGLGRVSVFHRGKKIKFAGFRQIDPKKEYDLVFRVDDVWLLDVGSEALTTIPPARFAQFYSDHGANDMSLWWHRHPLTSGWSGTDESAIRDTPLGGDPRDVAWMISLVYCTATGFNGRYDQFSPGLMAPLKVTVEGHDQNLEIDMQASVSAQTKRPSLDWVQYQGRIDTGRDKAEYLAELYETALSHVHFSASNEDIEQMLRYVKEGVVTTYTLRGPNVSGLRAIFERAGLIYNFVEFSDVWQQLEAWGLTTEKGIEDKIHDGFYDEFLPETLGDSLSGGHTKSDSDWTWWDWFPDLPFFGKNGSKR